MNILFIHHGTGLYGSDKILLYIIQMLSPQHTITVVLPSEGDLSKAINNTSPATKIIFTDYLPIVHSKLSFLGYLSLPRKILRCKELLKGSHFDFVFCNTLANVLSLFVIPRKNTCRVLYIHEIIKNKFLCFGFSFLAKLGAKKVICVSHHVKDNFFFAKKYSVIHNGIPDVAKTERKNIIGEKLKFVLPGRFMPQKGQWFLLDALSLLDESYKKQIRIDLYGSPPPFKKHLEKELKEKIVQSGLSEVVTMHSFTNDISLIYENANIILVPSIMADPFPTTVLEAMMFGKPLIVTNNGGGATEITDDSFSKVIVPNDTKDFANAIKFFVDKKDILQQYSHNARKKFCEYLTFDCFKKRFFDEFKELKNKE